MINVLIWVPLFYTNSWRGEGIAQTIENIVKNSDKTKIRYTLLVNKKHYYEVMEELNGNNVDIIPLSIRWLFFDKIFITNDNKEYNFNEVKDKIIFNLLDAIKVLCLKKINKKLDFSFLKLFLHAIRLLSFTYASKINRFKKYDVIWIPVPIIQWCEHVAGIKVQSFWDPFAFEYLDFKNVAPYLMKKYLVLFKNISHVITQSNNNKEYLTFFYNLEPDKVSVIYNGSPDYSGLLAKYARNSFNAIVGSFPDRRILADTKYDLFEEYKKEFINKSLLFRLQKRLTPKTKIIMVSTQARVYKGFGTLLYLFDKMVNRLADIDLILISTAEIPKDLKNKYSYLYEKFFEITRVSSKQHAFLYSISNLVLHPSFVEGGLGSYPQFEAASVGTPALINRGRHTDEMIDVFGEELSQIVCDFTNIDLTISKIKELLFDDLKIQENIKIIKSAYLDWKDVSSKYEKTFIEVAHKYGK